MTHDLLPPSFAFLQKGQIYCKGINFSTLSIIWIKL